MDFLLLLFLSAAVVLGLGLAIIRRRGSTTVSLDWAPHQVRVIANAARPARDLAATLPRRDAERRARLDRHYGYELKRRPSYRPDLKDDEAARLRPVQVIRVKSRAEREALRQDAPEHLKVVFVEESDSEARVTVPLPQRRPGRS
jgi:hypothetical protein